MSRKKIMLWGLYGQGNIGNDCTLQAMVCNLRNCLPAAEIRCICSGPNDTSSRHNIPSYPIDVSVAKFSPRYSAPNNSGARTRVCYLLSKYLRKVVLRVLRVPLEIGHWITVYRLLKGVDALIMPGTGLLVDYSTTPFGYPYYVFKWVLLGKLRRCKILIVSVGAGPIYHTLSRRFIKYALSLADYRSYRDNSSRHYLDTIGFKSKSDPVYPDLAFSLPRAIMPTDTSRSRLRPVIGVGLVDYAGQCGSPEHKGEDVYRDYLNKTGLFIKWLLTKNYRVRLLIGDVTCDTPVKNDLLKLLSQNGTKLEDGQIIDEPIANVEDLLLQLAQTDIVVSARFHNIVLSLILGKPVISLSYTDKFDSLMEDFGMMEYCHRLETFDVDRLITQFLKLEKNAESLTRTIESKTEQCRKALDQQYASIFEEFSRN